MSLLDQLVSYYSLGSTADAHGVNTLTNNNGVTFAAGKVGNAAVFDAASSMSLSVADNSTFNTGAGVDFSVSLWLWSDLSGFNDTDKCAACKGDFTGEWRITTSRVFGFSSVTLEVRGQDGLQSALGASITQQAWYHVVLTFNAATGSTGGYLNGVDMGAPNQPTNYAATNAFPLRIGYDGSDPNYFNGKVDEVGYWIGRILTSTEVGQLYNGGDGLAYPLTVASVPATRTSDGKSF